MSRYRQSMREALLEVSESEVVDEEIKWEVKISGLPTFYADGKSRGAVRQALRKMLKRPDDIQSIERTTPAALKKIRRGQAGGQEPGETDEQALPPDPYDIKAKKGAVAAPGSGTIAKPKKAKASDVNKSIEQQMKDALKEKMNVDDVVNMIQFGKPFKVVDEEIPAELPPGQDIPKYKDISNAEVDKEDKKANKVKDKIEKEVLVPTQTKEEVEQYVKQISKDIKRFSEKEEVEEATAAELELANAKKADKKQQGGSLKHKIWPALASMRMPKVEDAVAEVLGLTGSVTKVVKKYAQKKDAEDQDKDPVGKQHEDVEIDELSKKTLGSYVKKAAPNLAVSYAAGATRVSDKRKKGINTAADKLAKESVAKKKVDEVAPPGWGHTKAEKEKTKPDKPKSKIGGSAHEFQKDLDSGKFKGLPGDKTYKDKKASMFKLMWSMKDKGDKPHYKPGVKDKLKSQYKKEDVDEAKFKHRDAGVPLSVRRARKKKSAAQMKIDMQHADQLSKIGKGRRKEQELGNVGVRPTPKWYHQEETLLDSAKRYLEEKADWNTAFKSAAQSRPPMRYKDAVSFIDTAGLNSTEKRSALKAAKKWLR